MLIMPQNCKCSSFYLQPKKKFNDTVCYKNGPAGVNQLCDVVTEMHTNAGLLGFYTKHSLRSIVATKLYRNNVDEQLIQEIVGHHSIAVRLYKGTSDKQCKLASNCIFHHKSV